MHHRVRELHNIMPIQNMLSVLEHGILSHQRASRLQHKSIAMGVVQDRRDKIRVPGGLKLHQYANLYFDAHNPMMYKRKDNMHNLCILRVSTDVAKIDGTVIADRNASSDYVRFLSPNAVNELDFDKIFAADWRHPEDRIEYLRHRSIKCAELLIPDCVDVRFILGAYVADGNIANKLRESGFTLPVDTNQYMFFSE